VQNKIRKKIDSELARFTCKMDKIYPLRKISPLLSKETKDFILRKGKRLRPILFVIGYLGFAKKPAPNLYRAAVSLELLHDFLIIHDDIIDKSDMRRGKPSMHKRLENYLSSHKNIKFDGQDLSLVVGDIMYAMAIHAFLSIKEDVARKERALKRFVEAAINTGAGEFAELLYGIKDIKDITKQDVYKIYDLKTAFYSFAAPLSTGAILAGANRVEAERLFKSGMCLGRAFQIKDDILGIFADEKKTGKSSLTDLQEGKKTILIWRAYNNSNMKDRLYIRRILSKGKVTRTDLLKIRKILAASGALDYAKKEISLFSKKAEAFLEPSVMRSKYKNLLRDYTKELLDL
jgi:geranylgeranyl diphosphate synthase type I